MIFSVFLAATQQKHSRIIRSEVNKLTRFGDEC